MSYLPLHNDQLKHFGAWRVLCVLGFCFKKMGEGWGVEWSYQQVRSMLQDWLRRYPKAKKTYQRIYVKYTQCRTCRT